MVKGDRREPVQSSIEEFLLNLDRLSCEQKEDVVPAPGNKEKRPGYLKEKAMVHSRSKKNWERRNLRIRIPCFLSSHQEKGCLLLAAASYS